MRLKKREGEIAQAIFVQHAMKQGLRVADPIGDSDPYDYLVGDGVRFWRTQVKSSSTQLPNDTYQVCVSKLTGYGRSRHFVPYSPSEIDVFAIVLPPEDSVYIVPIEIVDGRLGLTFHGRNNPRFGRWRPYFQAFDLLRQTGQKFVLPPDEPNAPSPRRQRPFGKRHACLENGGHENDDQENELPRVLENKECP